MAFCDDWSHSPAPVKGPRCRAQLAPKRARYQGDGLENHSYRILWSLVERNGLMRYNIADNRMRGTR